MNAPLNQVCSKQAHRDQIYAAAMPRNEMEYVEASLSWR
jgi:hypothetical protein